MYSRILNLYVSLLILWLPVNLFSQQKLSITLLNSKTSEPVPYANLCFENLQTGKQSYVISDLNGKASQDVAGPTILAVSAIGFQSRVDTLHKSGDLRILLEPALYDMDEVVVTAQMTPRKADQSIYQVKVISNRQISDKSATNMSELLQGELNLRIAQDASLGSSISINGLSGEHIKILIDGVPVIGRMNGNIDLSQLNLNNVDHVEIVEGPMSVIYGSNALAGVINIITKENSRNKFLASANSYYESVGVYNFDASTSLNKNKHSFSVTGGRNFFGGFSDPDTSRTQLWKPKLQYFSDLYYVYKNRDLKFRADGKFFRETILNKGEVRGIYELWALDNYFVTNRFSTKAQLTMPVGASGNIDVMASWSGYSRVKNSYRKDMTSLEESISGDSTLQDTTVFSTFLSRGYYAWKDENDKFEMQTGFDLNYEKGEGKRILDAYQEMGDYALFFNCRYNPAARISLQPGFRVAYNTRYKAPWVPSLNVKWTPVDDLNLRLSYARGFRAPSLKELYLYFVDINHDVRGNPNLQAENSHSYNLSFQYDKKMSVNSFGFELNSFVNNVKSKIDLVEDSANIYSYANISEFRNLGFNFRLKYKMHPRLNATLGVSRTGTFSSVSDLESKLENFYFSTDYSGELRYDLFNYNMNFSVFYKYNGKYPFYYISSEDVVELGYMNPYSTLDVSLNKSFFKKSLIFSVGGKNLFNITNIPKAGAGSGVHTGGDSSSPVGWGRTFHVGLKYTFGAY